MRTARLKIVFSMAVLVLLSGFTAEEADPAIGQPQDERSAQEALPQSQDHMWKLFGACTVHLDHAQYTYSIDYTPEVKALEGTQLTISGFMLPLEASDKFTRFLLSKRTPTCPFCPPGEPNEIVEVLLDEPVAWVDGIVAVTGTMQFTKNPELGLFFQLKGARLTPAS